MGALNILAKTAKAANEADKALPLRLARAAPKSQAEIDALATRVSKQMLGEHVGSGKPKDTTNLAGRSRKENERVKALDYEVTPTGAAKESVIYQPRKGDVNVAIPGDQTISDSILRRVGDIEGIDSHQQGGARYGLGKLDEEDPLFWASGEGPAQMAQNKFGRVADFYDPERVVGQHLAMGPVSNNFAMHFADANLRAMDYSKIKPKDMQAFDRLIANGYVKKNQKTGQMEHINFPEWPGIADPDAALEVMKANPELRKWFNDRMKTPKVTQPLGLPNGLDIQWAITEPQLRNMEVNLTGLSAGEMVPGAKLTDTAAHNTYEKGIRGKALGHQEVLTPFTLSYPDAAQHIASTQRPQDFTGTIQKVFPHQMVDDQWLDEVAKYRELIKKYTGQKSGGEIHMSNFEKRLRGIKDEEGKESMRKIMALMAGMIKGQPTDIASQTFKGRDYKTKKNPSPTSPSMPSFAFKGKQYAEGGVTKSEPNRFRLPKFRRGGGSQKGKDKPMYEAFTQGLGPMLYGAARGTAAGLAGAPGDIEELGRMGINYVGEKAGKPNLVNEESALPTSERVIKKIPSLKDLGAGKEAQHTEDMASKLGMYGVSQIVAPKVGTTIAKGVKTAGKEMGELAAHKIATGQPLIPGLPASMTNPPVMNIIKPEGGNWRQIGKTEFGQNLKDSTSPRHMEGIRGNPKKVYEDTINKMDTVIERMKDAGQWNDETERAYANLRKQAENTYAIDTWVDSNLTNYVKKQMGTEKDPVRLLADEGISQFAGEGAMRDALNWSYQQAADARKARKKLGMPEDPMAKTNMGKFWEIATDDLIGNKTISAKEYKKKQGADAPDWLKQVPDSTPFYGVPPHGLGSELGFDHIIDVLKEDLATGRIRPDQLNKVSMKQAVERTHQYNQDLAKAQEAAKAKRLEGLNVHKEYPEGYRWVQLDKPGQFAAESEAMGHSVRGYEPPRGHSEWTKESGEAGNLGYGLGGYEAIKRGDAKIYSLVDKEGRPHTTIEVGSDYDAPSWYEKHKKILESDTPLPNDPNFKTVREMHSHYNETSESPSQYIQGVQMHLDEAGIPYAQAERGKPTIHQIKGKQNRAPNPEYLPYVQDFVRSSEWDEIGDLHNTGLKTLDQAFPNYEDAKRYGRTNPNARYVTQADIDAYHKQVNEELLNEYSKYRLKPDPESKNTLGRNDLMTIRELAELEFPGDLQKQANMIRGAMQGTTEPGAYSGSIFPPLQEKKGGAISVPKFTLKMGAGGLLKGAIKGAKTIKKAEAPSIIIPSDISKVKEAIRQSKGDFGARRVERAADEIPNLEKMYKEKALRDAFGGDNAKAMMTMNPADFEKYATPVIERTRHWGSLGASDPDKINLPTEDYIKYLRTVGPFDDVPFLEINKQEEGLPLIPFISGHEGRHRNRTLANKGEKTGLVQLLPRAELREPFPRRSQEEYIEALKKELEMTNNVVEPQVYFSRDAFAHPPQIKRPAINLPDIYAKGGAVQSLESNLPKLPKTDYKSIDELMTEISKRHKTAPKKLHDEFVAKHHMTPDTWIKRK